MYRVTLSNVMVDSCLFVGRQFWEEYKLLVLLFYSFIVTTLNVCNIQEYAESRTSSNMEITEELSRAAEDGSLADVQHQLRIATCHIDAVDEV